MEPSGSLGQSVTLHAWLRAELSAADSGETLSGVVEALATCCAQIAVLIRTRAGDPGHGSAVGSCNADGDSKRGLDVVTHRMIFDALTATSTAYFASEEEDAINTLSDSGRFAVAVDPLDGSSNIDANVSIGTIFSVFPAIQGHPSESFFRAGREQVVAGYAVYGPHTALVLTVGRGTHLFILDEDTREFRLARAAIKLPSSTNEFAINMSNYRHWYQPVRNFVDDCIAGAQGPRGKDFNMRWVASLVADTHRILARGGVFLYPADSRKGYQQGRLRHVYEAAPIALLIEQAGGKATDGVAPILDKVPVTLHQRTPLIFGSSDKVSRIESYHTVPAFSRDASPLFRNRGLFSN